MYYATVGPSVVKAERLVYKVEPVSGFESEASRVALQNVVVKNKGNVSATNVSVAIDFPQQGVIRDKNVVASSGAASGVQVTNVAPNTLSLHIPALIPSESVKVLLLLDGRPQAPPSVSVKSEASIGVVDDAIDTDEPKKSSAIGRFLAVLLPVLALGQAIVVWFLRRKGIAGFRPAAGKSPNNTAFVLLHRGRTADAEDLLKRTIQTGMGDAYVFSNYALCLAVKGEFEDAHNFLKASAMFGDESTSATGVMIFNAALIAFLRGDPDNGVARLRDAIKVRPHVTGYCKDSVIFEELRLKYHDRIGNFPKLR